MSYVKACASSELENEKGKCVVLGGKKIAIFRANGTILAVDDTCTHDEASLAEGCMRMIGVSSNVPGTVRISISAPAPQ